MTQEPTPDAIGETILTVIRELLGSDTISPSDDYYLAGGHSLLIVRIIRSLRDRYGIELDARQFAANAQIAALMAAGRPLPVDPARAAK
jgi:acyl carrier protein